MFKKICTLFVTMFFISLCFNIVFAEDEIVDMSEWKFIQLESNEEYTISKYYSKINPNKYAFCIEPDQHFNKQKTYYKRLLDDEYIFNIVKAYEKYGLNFDNDTGEFNYYIATQILLWEHLNDKEYIFDKDYSQYKQEIKDYASYQDMPPLTKSSSPSLIELEVGDCSTIDGNYENYDVIIDEGIEIIENNENGITYQITSNEPEYKQLTLIPNYDPKDYAYVYYSSEGQDIYCFEGNYETLKPKNFSLYTPLKMPQYVDINYSKVDTDSNPISGAMFTLFQINVDNPDSELIFIQTNTEINLLDALLEDYAIYQNLSIELSERYNNYLNGFVINTSEIGYFPFKIYNDEQLIKEGTCFVSDDINQTNGSYSKIPVLTYFKGSSEENEINTISSVEKNKLYYLCESEPKKGYEYTHNACQLIDTSTYNNEVIEFVNKQRTYTLRLMKQSPYEVLLDGAKFKISYLEDDSIKELILTTGYLNIDRENNNRYLIYRHENEDDVKIIEFDGDYYSTNDVINGKYYYYQSNSNDINYSLLNNNYTYVLKGGFCIENMPYSSSITIEELEAPIGFMITEPIYHITPNISYSEITFRNFRVNEFDILPKKKFIVPKTCIEA